MHLDFKFNVDFDIYVMDFDIQHRRFMSSRTHTELIRLRLKFRRRWRQ